MRRLLSAWLPNFPLHRLRRHAALPPDRPVATVQARGGLRLLACVDAAAEAAGLRVGQKLADARALCAALHVVDADPAADLAALERLAAWCRRYTPLAAADPPGGAGLAAADFGLWLDITGCAHLFGGEAALAADLAARLKRHGVASHIAVAGTTGAAWALARWTAVRRGAPVILPPGEEAAALDALPVACLRLDARTMVGLRRVGLRSVGDLARLPRTELGVRYGAPPLLRLGQALGTEAEAIAWPMPPPPWEERVAFAEPIGTAEDLGRALDLLAGRLCARLEAKGLGGLRFTALFFRVDNRTATATVAVGLPVRAAPYLTRLLAAKLETVDPGYGVEVMALAAEATAPLAPPQEQLDRPDAAEGGIAAIVDTLANRLGPERLWRVAPGATHVPERAVKALPPLDAGGPKVAREAGREAGQAPSWMRDPAAPRPVRLLRRPELIEVTALLPDEPPVMFRWRRALHRVRAASGPERIGREWWQHAPDGGAPDGEAERLRDYYCVEDTDGARFWIFRAGSPGGAVEPRWFLQGLFG